MCGLPFSGKSTLSKAISEYLDIPRISFDETWIKIEKENKFIPGENAVEQWKYICNACEQEATKLLQDGISVVYDNLGTTKEQRNTLRKLANAAKSESVVVYVDVSKEEVIKRREDNLINTVRAQVSDENFNNALKQFERPSDDEKVLVYNPNQDLESWLKKHKNVDRI